MLKLGFYFIRLLLPTVGALLILIAVARGKGSPGYSPLWAAGAVLVSVYLVAYVVRSLARRNREKRSEN